MKVVHFEYGEYTTSIFQMPALRLQVGPVRNRRGPKAGSLPNVQFA